MSPISISLSAVPNFPSMSFSTILKGRNNQPVPQIKKEETLQINLNNMFDINNADAVVLRSHTS